MDPGTVIGERFVIEYEAGAGGMGTVFRALDRATNEPVALKLMRGRTEQEALRFTREAEALRVLDHPRIVRYVAHGTTAEGDPYLVMQWLAGEDLDTRLARGPMGVDEALSLARHVAEALAAAHARGIVHRDIKPSNIFLVDGDLTRATVLDFGVARQLEGGTSVTTTGAIVGTLQYMAPEQARGERGIDARADVFALGCVLYECITGRPAFGASQGLAVVAQILFDDPPRPSTLRTVGAEIDALVARMIAKERARRPSDGSAVALEIGTLRGSVLDASQSSERSQAAIGTEEQRVVSVVVANLAETSDVTWTPDSKRDVDDRIAAAAESARARVEMLGGGLMIASVAPAAGGGDQAIRAARLALSLSEIVGNGRVAVVTGLAVVRDGPIDGALVRRAVTLTGANIGGPDVPARAGVRVDSATAAALAGRFDVVRDGEAFVVARELPAITTGHGHRDVPCVGRERELTEIDGALAECVGEGFARVVLVTGDAGLGKTRLCDEWLTRTRGRHPDLAVLRGRGDWERAGSPFSLLGPAIRDVIGFPAGADAAQRHQALVAFASARLAHEEVARVCAFLGEMIGEPTGDDEPAVRAARRDAQLMADGMQAAWLALIESLLRVGGVSFVLEDLHWGDLPSLRFVDAALRRFHDRPLFVFATARPEYRDTFPDLWKGRELLEVALTPLARRAAERLVRASLPKDASSDLVARIVDGAEGHPFLIAQLAESAASGSLETVPATVFDVLRIRLDALTPMQRRVLRGASVYGERFWHGGLVALLEPLTAEEIDGALAEIAGHAIVSASDSTALVGQREFTFRHALLREASYESIPETERAHAHGAAGRWLEAAGERDAMVLARQYERGGVYDRAARQLARAAESALAASDMNAAFDRASRALEYAARTHDGLPEDSGPLERVRAEASYYSGDLQRAAECARRATDRLARGSRAWFQAAGWAVTSSGQRGDNDEVERWVAPVMQAAVDADAQAAQAICLSRILTQLVAAGRMAHVPQALERARELTSAIAASDPQAVEWIERVNAAVALRASDFAGALDAANRAATAAQLCADERGLCFARIVGATGYLLIGEFESAEQSVRQGLALAERLGVEYLRHWGTFTLGKIYAQRGDLPRARETLESAIRGVATSPRIAGSALVYLARACHLATDYAASADSADRALAMKITPSLRAAALAARARADVALGRAREALVHAVAAMTVLDELGAIEESETLIRLAHAEALLATGSPDAERAVSESRDRIVAIAAAMSSARRDSFLTRVPENVATLALAPR